MMWSSVCSFSFMLLDNTGFVVLLAHRKLHNVVGILHHDISVQNILINPEGVEGNHGILIDSDHAIRVRDTSPFLVKRKIVFAVLSY
jgi:hypothetical protein